MTSASSTVATTYRAAPLLLNHERGADGKWSLASTWCNLGLWPEGGGATFRSACEALARRLGETACLAPGDAVLDIGVGYGDQTAFWAREFGVRRVVGVEPSAVHVAAGRAALAGRKLLVVEGGPIELHVGSAAQLPPCCDEPCATPPFDAVLCLDCAYHFRPSRAAFLRRAGSLLRPAGRFAAVDLVVAESRSGGGGGCGLCRFRAWWRSIWLPVARRAIALLCEIPSANLVGAAEYVAALEAGGLTSVRLERLSPRVLHPFAANAARQRAALSGRIGIGEAIFLWTISALFGFVARYQVFDVVLVRADKPG